LLLFTVGSDALGERVAVDAQDGSGAREVFLMAGQGFLDVELLKFGEGFVEHYLTIEHFVYQGFKAGAHLHVGLSGGVIR
jgi:hypothetical protein